MTRRLLPYTLWTADNTVYELISAGREVVVADNLQTGFRAAVHPKARFDELDIRNRAALDMLFQAEKIEGVIHFAASSQVGESMSDPLKYYDNNLYGTMVLLRAMVDHGVEKIVLVVPKTTPGYAGGTKIALADSKETKRIPQ